MAVLTAAVKAFLEFVGASLANAETITVGKKQYTFLDTVGTTANNVHVGADDDGTIQNLVAAINKDLSGEAGTAGTDYAVLTEINAECSAEHTTTDTLVVTAKVAGTVGNSILVAEANGGAWDSAAVLLSGGTGSVAVALDETATELLRLVQASPFGINSGVATDLTGLAAEIEAID